MSLPPLTKFPNVGIYMYMFIYVHVCIAFTETSRKVLS